MGQAQMAQSSKLSEQAAVNRIVDAYKTGHIDALREASLAAGELHEAINGVPCIRIEHLHTALRALGLPDEMK